MVTNDNDEIKQKASEKEWDYSASFKDKADDYENYLMNEARADTLQTAIARMRAAKSNMCLRDRIILLDEIELLEKELKRLTK